MYVHLPVQLNRAEGRSDGRLAAGYKFDDKQDNLNGKAEPFFGAWIGGPAHPGSGSRRPRIYPTRIPSP